MSDADLISRIENPDPNQHLHIRDLHVEPSSFCNARCPGCPRNASGYNIPELFTQNNLSVERFKEILYQFPNVVTILFNGNLGDPMMNPHIVDLTELTKAQCTINTNGSIGRLKDYEKLAQRKVSMYFSIDGLEDTNHLYRQDVQWSKVMERAKAFIDAGGDAVWKFILFKHNSHQVDDARSLSKQMGFRNFEVDDHGRNHFPALTKDKKISHWILPADGSAQPDDDFDVDAYIEMIRNPINLNPHRYSCKVNCMHLSGSAYISAKGGVHPCCFQGFDLPDRKSVPLDDFPKLQKTWNTDNVDLVCGSNCEAVGHLSLD